MKVKLSIVLNALSESVLFYHILGFQHQILHVPWSRMEASKRGFISRITTAYNRLHGECDVFGAPTLKCFRQQVNKAMSCNQ